MSKRMKNFGVGTSSGPPAAWGGRPVSRQKQAPVNLARSVCPFLAGRAAFFQILNVRKQEHEHFCLL